jgi:hypothetical protein
MTEVENFPLRLGVYRDGRPEEQILDALMSGACAEGQP